MSRTRSHAHLQKATYTKSHGLRKCILFFSKLPLWCGPYGLPWLSARATTNFDLLRRPSKKVSTRSQMSSALLEVKVYSSPLMVARVKLWPWSFPPLYEDQRSNQHKEYMGMFQGLYHPGPFSGTLAIDKSLVVCLLWVCECYCCPKD